MVLLQHRLRNHLHQTGSEDLTLRELYVESVLKENHVVSRWSLVVRLSYSSLSSRSSWLSRRCSCISTTLSSLAVPSATSVVSLAARSSWRSCFSLSRDNSSRLRVKASTPSSIVITASLLASYANLLDRQHCVCSTSAPKG